MKLIQKFVVVIALMFAFIAPASAGGYLDDVGGGSTSTDTTKAAAPAPEGVTLHQCGQAYGSVSLEMQPVHPQYQYMLSQFGFSSQLVQPMARHTVATSACFAIVAPSDAATARYVLKVTVQNLSTASNQSFGTLLMRSYAGAFAPKSKLALTSAQVEMSVIDMKTGELVATAIGTGKSDNMSAGTALLANAPGLLSGAPSQNPAGQVLASAFVDAFNQIAPFMDKVTTAAASTATSTSSSATVTK